MDNFELTTRVITDLREKKEKEQSTYPVCWVWGLRGYPREAANCWHFLPITTRWHHCPKTIRFLLWMGREDLEAEDTLKPFPLYPLFPKLDVIRQSMKDIFIIFFILSDHFYCFSFFFIPVVPSETGNIFLTVSLYSCILLLQYFCCLP